MNFQSFFKCLAEKAPHPRVDVELLKQLVNDHHPGVGKVQFRFFQDFDGAEIGNFIWLEEQRTSAYEDPFNDAVVFINDRFENNRPMRRIIAAKELMHVFDAPEERIGNRDSFKALLLEIESNPVPTDASLAYAADRGALWKATLALVPPWIRDEFRAQWIDGSVKAPELAARWWLPENVVTAAMGDYYDRMYDRFVVKGNLHTG